MLSKLMDNQARLIKDQTQITTGKKEESYSGLANEISTLLGAKTVFDQTQGYLRAADHADRFLSTNDIQLGTMVTNAENVRDTMLEAIAQEETFALNELMGESYSTMVSALNTSVGGVHIFSGARSDKEPVTAKTIADLTAATNVSDIFQNDQRRPSAKVGQNTTLEYGLLADEVGQEVFQVYKNIADFNAGPSGPLSGKLDATQINFLKGELANMDTAIDNLRVLVARNGTRQKNVENFTKEHQNQEAFLKVFISDIEDVDVAEAISRMNNDQVALEASFKITGELSKLTLLNFI
jgi:flagellar hook-associated protein 3 FlgL